MADKTSSKTSTPSPTSAKEQELAHLLQRTVTALGDLDRRLNTVRLDVGSLVQQAGSQAGTPSRTSGLGQQGVSTYGGWTDPNQLGHALSQGHPGLGSGASFGPSMPSQGMGAMPQPTGNNPYTASGMSMPSGQQISIPGTGNLAQNAAMRSRKELQNLPPTVRTPSLEIIDTGKEYIVEVELPGVKDEAVEVFCNDNALQLEARTSTSDDEGAVVMTERPPTVFQRVVPFPTRIQSGKCNAELEDGILTITVPKKEPSEGLRQINVGKGKKK